MGIPIAPMPMAEAATWISAWVQSHAGRAVFTVNPEIAMLARRDPEFAAILRSADLNVADGVGILLAAWLARQPVPARTAGIDLVKHLAEIGDSLGWRVYLLGGAAGVAQRAGEAMARRHPKLNIVGWSATDAGPDSDTVAVNAINATRPDLLLVAFGAPRQERWIVRNLPNLDIGVAMGVGGSLDFLAGDVPRAPRQLRALGLEWLYRLVRQPWRWRRMLALPAFALAALRQVAASRRREG
jgi:N-acetylglucosaminyldiphosphoundecaprenol N-acetyl-beta-D-mannosaminyltransferase